MSTAALQVDTTVVDSESGLRSLLDTILNRPVNPPSLYLDLEVPAMKSSMNVPLKTEIVRTGCGHFAGTMEGLQHKTSSCRRGFLAGGDEKGDGGTDQALAERELRSTGGE